MSSDLISIDQLKNFMGKEAALSSDQDVILAGFITAACEAIRSECSRDFDQRTYTEVRNGPGGVAMRLHQWPVLTSPIPTVTENGTQLVVALGYSTTADVILDPTEGRLYRQPGGTGIANPPWTYYPGTWSKGYQNVTVVYTAGYVTPSMAPAVVTVPADLRNLVCYVASWMFKQAAKKEIGDEARTSGSGTVTFVKALPEPYLSIMAAYSRVPFVE